MLKITYANKDIQQFYGLIEEFFSLMSLESCDNRLKCLLKATIRGNKGHEKRDPMYIASWISDVDDITLFIRKIGRYLTKELASSNPDIPHLIIPYRAFDYDEVEKEMSEALQLWVYDDTSSTAPLEYIIKVAGSFKAVLDFLNLCSDINQRHRAELKGGTPC